MPFEINAKKFLLTYAKCTLSKEEVLETLSQDRPVRFYIIALESHQDGSPHIHACMHFEDRVHSTNARVFDIKGFHCNVELLKFQRDFNKAAEYCRKDKDFITNIEAKISKRAMLAQAVIEHGRIDGQLLLAHPELLFVPFNSISQWMGLIRKPKTALAYPTTKKRHRWLYGVSNTGKTTRFRTEVAGKNICEIPTNNDYKCNEDTEILWIDEYKGALTIQQLNKLCDGNTQLNTKGGSTWILFPMVYVISNFSISECYKNSTNDMLDTLFNRFIETHLTLVYN